MFGNHINNLFFKTCVFILGFVCSINLMAETKIAVLGDSLTQGHGVAPEDAFPKVLESILVEQGYEVKVISNGVSGAVTSSGLKRLKLLIEEQPDVVLIELGANDGLRSLPIAKIRRNLEEMITYAKDNGAHVILAGMRLPHSYGKVYRKDYEALFPALAEENSITLIPFILEGVAGNRDLNLSDGFHPNEDGHRIMAETIRPYVVQLIE
ncbi:MAG: arylesterase [Parachlamydiales bacterium]|jgi:acyl-CoA thioesterase-1